ncbi:MAG: DUF2791 family P-loop domain-containing protein [Deltaproteobacteria bacterium]|nr:DUF2791 family P-loop domain-containing protein [Deltaproteobacteria bacterium]
MPSGLSFTPERIGDHAIVAEIGRGGMGVVYRVRDERTGQEVALKMLAPEAASHRDSALRFKREFRAIRRVVHPNVVRVFEAGTYRGAPYFTMELVDGRNIRLWLDGEDTLIPYAKDTPPGGALSLEQRQRLNDPARIRRMAEATVQVCFALSAIHAHRIVHRDLKPDNILVTSQGVVKLMDFGIAKQLTDHGPTTSGGMVVGTFKYLSPEQALGLDIDGRADLYCLGIVLYELLAGRHPFYSETSVGYAYHHARTPAPAINRFNPEVDGRIAAIAERLLGKSPADRYATADDLIADLKEAVAGVDDRVKQLKATTKRFALPPFQLSSDPLFAPAMIGRDREKQALLAQVDRLLSGRGRFVVIEGDSGSGKSRLLREISVEAREQGAEFVTCRAALNERAPYAPLIEAFDQIARQLGTRSRKEVQRVLGSDGPVLARTLPAIAALPGVDKRPLSALAPEDEQIRFRAAVADVLGRYCEEKPCVLVIDDLHEADELTVDLVRHLAGTLAGLVFGDAAPEARSSLAVFATVNPEATPRAEALARLIGELEGQPSFLRLKLSPIDVAGASRLLRSMLGGAQVSNTLAEALHRQAGGLPSRLEEILRSLAESGDLVRRGRRWMVRASTPQGSTARYVPADEVGLEELPDLRLRGAGIGDHRLEALSAVARDVAERAAVIGLRVRSDVLFRVALRPEEELLDALDELLKRGVLLEEKGERGHRFVNEGVRGALLAAIEPERRGRLHLLAAHSLEEIARSETGAIDPEQLATQYRDGGEPLRAFDYMADAARRSLQANAVQAALALVERMQEILRSEETRATTDPGLVRRHVSLLLLRLLSMLAAGRAIEVIGLAASELPTLRDRAEGRLVAEAIYLLAVAEQTLGELDSAIGHVAEVLAVTERGGAHALRCKAKRLAGEIYSRRGQSDSALRYFRETLDLARAIGDDLEEELARGAIAGQRFESGDLAAARRDYENLLGVAEQKGERSRAAQYVLRLGLVHHETGDYERAVSSYERSREMAKAISDHRTNFACLNCIGAVHVDQGELGQAFEALGRARVGLLASGGSEDVVACLLNLAEAHLLRDENGPARDLCDEAVLEAERAGMALLVAHARIVRGAARVRLGDRSSGLADLEAGLAAARVAEANRLVLTGLIYLAEALIVGEEQGRGIQYLDEARRRAEQTGYKRYSHRVANVRERLMITAPN